MKSIAYGKIVQTVAGLCIESNYFLGEDVFQAMKDSLAAESSRTGRRVLEQLMENAGIAAAEQVPLCQDTGIAVVFLEIGQDVGITGGFIGDAVTEGVRKGYEDGYLRRSMCDPLSRKNTGDNTPAIIHTEIVPGDNLKITVAPKGGGSENMSALAMLPPAAGIEGIKDFVLDRVGQAGPNACPPLLIGVGIGGNFEKAALLAKKALLREVGKTSSIPGIALIEKELLSSINNTGIGPAGYGGRTTALQVAVEYYPCHIASLPVALNINCHAARHKTVIL